jgi:hypothetical protein
MAISTQEALQQASEDLGIDLGPDDVTIDSVALAENSMPFLRKELTGKSAWQVQLKDAVLRRALSLLSPKISQLSVILSPDSGRILKLSSRIPPGEPQLRPFPEPDEEERQMLESGERFVGLPPERPSISFIKALKIIGTHGPGGVEQARQLIAYYVTDVTVGFGERTVWVVQVRGIPPLPMPSHGLRIPEDARNHLRHLIDASSGEWLTADTVPQPTT